MAAPQRRARARPETLVPADGPLRRHRVAVLVACAAVGAAVFACWIVAKATDALPPATEFDHWQALRTHGPALLHAAHAVASLADPLVAILTVAGLASFCARRHGHRAAVLAFAVASIVVVTTVAKDLPGRRTTLPSGHAAYAVAVGGLIAYLLARHGQRAWAAAVAVLFLCMGPGRVIEGVHTVADVITGMALGVAWLTAVLAAGGAWADPGRTAQRADSG